MNRVETRDAREDRGAEAWHVPPQQCRCRHPPAYEGERLSSSNAIMQRAQAPTAERTVTPAGASGESLTSNPRVREDPGS